MKHLYLCAAAFIILFTVSCSKDKTSSPAEDNTVISFTVDKIGNYELFTFLQYENPLVRISGGESNRSFTYEITGSNGLNKSTDTTVKGSDKLDIRGNATISVLRLADYKDGELTVKVRFTDADVTVQGKIKKAEHEIGNYKDFIYMASFRLNDSSDHYVQVKDFAFPDSVFTTAAFPSYINGSYDGRGFKITGLAINSPGQKGNNGSPRIGLFAGLTETGVIKNVRLELSDKGITATGGVVCGGLVGDANGTIMNCSVTGNVLIPKDISGTPGGIIGYGEGVSISGCSFRGRITGSNIGGIMGTGWGATKVDMCYAYFSFDAYAAGGIAGLTAQNAVDSIFNSYAVVHDYDLPGFIAIGPYNYQTTKMVVTNCFANEGTAQTGVMVFPSLTDLNTQLSAMTINGQKTFKYDTDPTAPMKLWWE